jgi:hypothetical protein
LPFPLAQCSLLIPVFLAPVICREDRPPSGHEFFEPRHSNSSGLQYICGTHWPLASVYILTRIFHASWWMWLIIIEDEKIFQSIDLSPWCRTSESDEHLCLANSGAQKTIYDHVSSTPRSNSNYTSVNIWCRNRCSRLIIPFILLFTYQSSRVSLELQELSLMELILLRN